MKVSATLRLSRDDIKKLQAATGVYSITQSHYYDERRQAWGLQDEVSAVCHVCGRHPIVFAFRDDGTIVDCGGRELPGVFPQECEACQTSSQWQWARRAGLPMWPDVQGRSR